MFTGYIGFIYLNGSAGAWLMAGQLTGDIILFYFFSERIKSIQTQYKSLSYEDLLSQRVGEVYSKLRLFLALMIVLFLAIYAAAQLKASSKALHAILDWPDYAGITICALFVLLYCWSGGIRASIWTDAIQSIIMIGAGISLSLFSIHYVGGLENFSNSLKDIPSNYYTFFPDNLATGGATGLLLFYVGWIFTGLCVLGQPHVMVRIMALDSIKNINKMRLYYYAANILLVVSLFFVGVSSRLILKEKLGMEGFDPEMAMPLLSMELFPSVFVGLMLAAIFASTMSTVDSQIISCSAAISQSILPKKKLSPYLFNKVTTLILLCVTVFIAFFASSTVFDLVIFSWSTLGVVLGSAAFIQFFLPKMKESLCMGIISIGGIITVLWRVLELHKIVPEALIGFLTVILLLLLFKAGIQSSQDTATS